MGRSFIGPPDLLAVTFVLVVLAAEMPMEEPASMIATVSSWVVNLDVRLNKLPSWHVPIRSQGTSSAISTHSDVFLLDRSLAV
jgi:hypothetical protein